MGHFGDLSLESQKLLIKLQVIVLFVKMKSPNQLPKILKQVNTIQDLDLAL